MTTSIPTHTRVGTGSKPVGPHRGTPDSAERARLAGTFGAVLVAERRVRGWTQAQLAEQAGVSRATVERLERGARRPSAGDDVAAAPCPAEQRGDARPGRPRRSAVHGRREPPRCVGYTRPRSPWLRLREAPEAPPAPGPLACPDFGVSCGTVDVVRRRPVCLGWTVRARPARRARRPPPYRRRGGEAKRVFPSAQR